MKNNKILSIVAISTLLVSFSCDKDSVDGIDKKPELSGMIAYDGGSGSGNTEIIVCNLKSGVQKVLSSAWNKISGPSNPAFSPDGKSIAFQGTSLGKSDIYIYDLTTGEVPVKVTSSVDGNCLYPEFSSDGNSILFTVDGQIAEIGIDGESFNIITFADSPTYTSPKFSQDGSSVIYSYTSSNVYQLGILNLNDMSERQLLFDLSVGKTKPVFYSDDDFCYVAKKHEYQHIRKGDIDDGDDDDLFGKDDVRFDDPAIVPGGYILMSAQEGTGSEIWLGETDNGGMEPLTDIVSGISFPAYSCHAVYSAEAVSLADPVNDGEETGGDDITSDTERPSLRGKVVFHNYSDYEAGDSRIWIYDFEAGTLNELSSSWTTVNNPMNAHFSPDGTQITFMGIGSGNTWDVFTCSVDGGEPVNITGEGQYRDEDPKFSSDGGKICFKRDGKLAEIDMATKAVTVLSDNTSDEYGMPYYSEDGTKIVFGGNAGEESYIGCWDIASSTMTKLYDVAGVVEYYPIVIDDNTFYYTKNVSSSNNHDQVCKGYFDGSAMKVLPFNKEDADYSDGYPVGSGWLILCSTRSGGSGAYDLYIANENSGAIYSLSEYNSSINTDLNELGPSYHVD